MDQLKVPFSDELVICLVHQLIVLEFIKLPITRDALSVFLLLNLVQVRVAVQKLIVHLRRTLI